MVDQKMVPFNICQGSLNSRQSDVVTNEGIGTQFLKVQVTGHFRVPETLTFKMRLGAQLSCGNEFYLHENEMFSISKAGHLPSFETEARGNSEMAYYQALKVSLLCCIQYVH